MLAVGAEKIILLYNANIYESADVISTFVYRKGLQEFNYGYSTAVGMFNSVINFVLIVVANKLAKSSAIQICSRRLLWLNQKVWEKLYFRQVMQYY